MKKVFKKTLKIATAAAVICFVFLTITAVYFISWETVEINNLSLCYSKVTKECIAADINWDGDTENMIFTLPDEYEGIKINSLGGTSGLGTPILFYIDVPDEMEFDSSGITHVATEEDLAGMIDENTITYKFTVNIGKNVKNFEYFHYKEYYIGENGKVMYIIDIDYEVSPDNKWAYSKDGKIYDKKTDELISYY